MPSLMYSLLPITAVKHLENYCCETMHKHTTVWFIICRCYWLHSTSTSSMFSFSFFSPFYFTSLLQINRERCCKISSKYIQISLRFTYSIPEYSMIADFIVVKYTISEEIWKKKVAFCCNLKLKELFSYRLCSNLNFQVTL